MREEEEEEISVHSSICTPLGSDSYLDTALLLPPELDFAKLALTDGITEDVLAKFGVFFPFAIVMPAATTSPWLFGELLISGGGDAGWRCRLVGRVGMGEGSAFSFAIDVDLGLGDEHAVEDLACLARGALRRGLRGLLLLLCPNGDRRRGTGGGP